MTTADFWNSLEFSYGVTYSFNRGPKLEALKPASRQRVAELETALLAATGRRRQELKQQLAELQSLFDLQYPLTEQLSAFHITAEPVARFQQDSELGRQVSGLLRTPLIRQLDWMCSPVYRDALAFYNERDELLSVLNICFSCDKMLLHTCEEVDADATVYTDLKALLTSLGHDINDSPVYGLYH